MMIECEVKTGQTVESIEHTRREGGDIVWIKFNKRGNWLMKGEMNIIEKGIDEWEGEIVEFVEIWEQSRWEGDKTVVV